MQVQVQDKIDRRFYTLPEGRLSAVHYNADLGPLRVVFIHANGFNALAYRELLEPLSVHSVALDNRGHGFSELPTHINALRNWHPFRDDISYFLTHYTPGPVVVSGHSFGATSAVLAAPLSLPPFAGYAGFDPVMMPWPLRWWPYLPGGRAVLAKSVSEAKKAGRRRFLFPSKEAAFERYRERRAFTGMPDAVLRDYLSGGTRPHAQGIELSASPSWERAIYLAQGNNSLKAAKALPENSLFIFAGKKPITSEPIRRALAAQLGEEQVICRANLRHLFPLQQTDIARGYLQSVIDRAEF